MKIRISNSKKNMLVITLGLVGVFGGLLPEFCDGALSDSGMPYVYQLAFAQRPDNEGMRDTILITSDPESIVRGRDLFEAKCKFCHHANSTETIVGPGLKGILKNRKLPVSKASATPKNVIKQLKQPFNRMPSFEYLTDKEISDVLAFLNTL